MTKYTPSAKQLCDTLEHIYYEIDQLVGTLIKTEDDVLNNALIESRLIHVRALLDFFQKSSRTKLNNIELDDVLSLDYGFAAQKVGIPAGYQERLNKDLAHLTYSRSMRLPADKPWPYAAVILPILICSTQFASHLISNYLPKHCPEKLTMWQVLVYRIKAMEMISGKGT